MANKGGQEEAQQQGVLLYYKYAPVPNLPDLVSFYESNCNSLNLLGRVRLSPNGVNVTVGGQLLDLKSHIESVQSNSLFDGTDFKLASCDRPTNEKIAKECGFTSLSIRVVKELVTLHSHPFLESPDISNAGRHLSPTEFHSVLQIPVNLSDEESQSKGLIVLDARNLYETRIGKFHIPGVETLDPEIRQYSDLPSWIDDNSEKLRDSHVLMYCTGGIRCEMASAYIKSKGAGFENVFQLYGGIQRYLEQYPDGGFFRGKNFVFDHRVSVGSSNETIEGACLLCNSAYDDYSPRCRCTCCRMLVLICDDCQQKKTVQYVCELCLRQNSDLGLPATLLNNDRKPSLIHSEQVQNPLTRFGLKPASKSDTIHTPELSTLCGTGPPRKLRLLCLHGFRQNASSFRGRTASLAKKLKNIAELVFVDAPHELSFIYQPSLTIDNICESPSRERSPPPSYSCKRKFAWFIAPSFTGRSDTNWEMADTPFDPLQYQQQTGGSDASLMYLNTVLSQEGPFDGVLGFSQGAAMAALLCAHKARSGDDTSFRFAVLCSGFARSLEKLDFGSINCPSLHIFGSDVGNDRQISRQASRNLACFFEDSCSVIVEHDCGHIIPTRSPYIDKIKDFLHQFL